MTVSSRARASTSLVGERATRHLPPPFLCSPLQPATLSLAVRSFFAVFNACNTTHRAPPPGVWFERQRPTSYYTKRSWFAISLSVDMRGSL